MDNPLTRSDLAALIEKLRAAFPQPKTGADLARLSEVYFEALNRFSLDAVRFAVRRAIEDGQYFPRVAQLRESAAKWDQANRASVTARLSADDPERCAICGAHASVYTLPDGRQSQRAEIFHDRAAHHVHDE